MIHPYLPVYPVLLASSSGTRLWAVSLELSPKQIVHFIGSDSLIRSSKNQEDVYGKSKSEISQEEVRE